MASNADKRKEQFQRQFNAAKQLHDQYVSQWLHLDSVYHGTKEFPKATQDLLRSRLRIPWAWQQVETIIPRIMDPDPKFDFQPVELGDRIQSEQLNALSRFDLNKDRFILKQRSFVEDGTVRGLAVAKVLWLQRKQKMRIRRTPDPEVVAEYAAIGEPIPDELTFEEKSVVVENRPTIIYVDPFDFFWDPSATNDSDWGYVFHRTWLSMSELKAKQAAGMYSNIDKLEPGNTSFEQAVRSSHENTEEAKAKRGAKKYPVLERFSRDGTVMAMCGDVVIRDIPTPFYHGDIPFAVYRSQPTPRSMVGVSEVEKIEHIQEAVWTTDNQRIDAVSLALNQILVLDPTIQGVRNLTFRPGAKIYANQAQRVDQLTLDPLQVPAFNETEAYLGAMQQMTGANAVLYGASLDQSGIDNATATGVNAAREEGNQRMHMKKLEFQLFEARIAKLMTQLNHQYRSAAELKRILGDTMGEMQIPAPEEIPMFLDVIPQGMSDSMSKAANVQNLNEILMSSKDLHLAPMGDGTLFSVKTFVERLIKLQGLDPSQAFVEEPPPPPMGANDGEPV